MFLGLKRGKTPFQVNLARPDVEVETNVEDTLYTVNVVL